MSNLMLFCSYGRLSRSVYVVAANGHKTRMDRGFFFHVTTTTEK